MAYHPMYIIKRQIVISQLLHQHTLHFQEDVNEETHSKRQYFPKRFHEDIKKEHSHGNILTRILDYQALFQIFFPNCIQQSFHKENFQKKDSE